MELLTIVFDTNVLWTDRKPSSAQWLEFRNVHKHYNCIVKIPPVVSLELIALNEQEISKKKSEINTAAKSVQRALKELNNHFSALGLPQAPLFDTADFLRSLGHLQQCSESINDMVPAQVQAIEEQVGSKVTLLEWPTESHQEIVISCSKQKAPFTHEHGKDKGYKDYLLWRTVINELKNEDGIFVLITKDSGFYGDGEVLHPDLQKDLTEINVSKDRFIICKDLSQFNNRFVTPYTTRDTGYEQQLRDEHFLHLSKELELYQEDFDAALDNKIYEYASFPTQSYDRTQTSITSYSPALLDVKEARVNPSSSHMVIARAICRYVVKQTKEQIYDGMFTLNESASNWLALECTCELYIDESGNLQAANLKLEDGISLCDMANCRLTISKDLKGPFLEVYASMELSEPVISLQHWKNNEIINQCLRDFGVGQFGWKQTLDTSEKQIYEVQRVPTALIKKWGYDAPTLTC